MRSFLFFLQISFIALLFLNRVDILIQNKDNIEKRLNISTFFFSSFNRFSSKKVPKCICCNCGSIHQLTLTKYTFPYKWLKIKRRWETGKKLSNSSEKDKSNSYFFFLFLHASRGKFVTVPVWWHWFLEPQRLLWVPHFYTSHDHCHAGPTQGPPVGAIARMRTMGQLPLQWPDATHPSKTLPLPSLPWRWWTSELRILEVATQADLAARFGAGWFVVEVSLFGL